MTIQPMLFTEANDRKDCGGKRVYQIKENGIRAIVHIKGGKVVGIRNRNDTPILYLFPELKGVSFNCGTAILDGEICVFRDGRSVFYGGIDQRRSSPTPRTLTEHPATLVVFDVLKIESQVTIHQSYSERYKQLQDLLISSEQVRIAKNYTDEKALWKRVVRENLEGVMIKPLNAPYEVGTRSTQYLKVKNYKTATVTVTQTEPNEKGTKIYGTTQIGGTNIQVECQMAGIYDISKGTEQDVKYLDIVGNRLIQPTKVTSR